MLPLCLCAPAALADRPAPADPVDTGASYRAPGVVEGDTPGTVDLHTIRVIGKRPGWTDPLAFRPLFESHDNVFHRHWNEPPSVEEVSLSGGYILLDINYGLQKAAGAVTRLPGCARKARPDVSDAPPVLEGFLRPEPPRAATIHARR